MLERRTLLKASVGGLAASITPFSLRAQERPPTGKRTIFFVVDGGWDQAYLFDSRPLEFVAAGLQQIHTLDPKLSNFDPRVQGTIGVEPRLEHDGNGGETFIHPLAWPLADAHRDKMAIIRGVVTDYRSEGHPENQRKFLTGSINPASSLFLQPILGRTGGFLNFVSNNDARFPESAKGTQVRNPADLYRSLANLARIPLLSNVEALSDYLRTVRVPPSDVNYSRSIRSLREAMEQQDVLQRKLTASNTGTASPEFAPPPILTLTLRDLAETIQGIFSVDLTRHLVITITGSGGIATSFDHHDAATLRNNALTAYAELCELLEGLITMLDRTDDPVFPGTKLLQNTTVAVSADFNRTMINDESDAAQVFEHGSDHNARGNVVLLFGRGIRGGKIIGASDHDRLSRPRAAILRDAGAPGSERFGRRQPGTTFLTVRPPGFGKERAVAGKPYFNRNPSSTFDPNAYITPASILNTILTLFDVRPRLVNDPTDDQPPTSTPREAPAARVIDDVLA